MQADTLLAIAAAALDSTGFSAILALLIANVLSGVGVGLFRGTLNLAALADWLRTRAAPFILGDLSFQVLLLAKLPSDLGITAVVSAAVHLAVCVALLAKILQNAAELGLPIPNVLTDRSKPPEPVAPPPSKT